MTPTVAAWFRSPAAGLLRIRGLPLAAAAQAHRMLESKIVLDVTSRLSADA
jgi:hypothetical protein